MKIAVFGDSFAFKAPGNTTPNWVDHVRAKYTTVDNYSLSGSSLFYSIQHFYKNHCKYDKILFVVTTPGRILLPTFISDNLGTNSIPGIATIELWIKRTQKEIDTGNTKNKFKLEVYQAIKNYFYYVKNHEYDVHVHDLMVDDIIKQRPDVILIPAFKDSHKKYANETTMHDISKKEEFAWNLEYNLDGRDSRNSHMTVENNAIFAEQAIKWIQGSSVKINLDDFVTPMNKEFYLRKGLDE